MEKGDGRRKRGREEKMAGGWVSILPSDQVCVQMDRREKGLAGFTGCLLVPHFSRFGVEDMVSGRRSR